MAEPITEAFPLVANLLALPNGWACGLGVSDQRGVSYIDDTYGNISFTTGALVVDTGWIALYLITAEEPGYFTDGINPNSRFRNAAAMIGAATQANQIARLPVGGQMLRPRTTYNFGSFSVKAVLGSTPMMTSPVIWNNLGGPLAVTPPPRAAHTVLS